MSISVLNQSSNRTPSLISVVVPAHGEIECIAEQLTSLGQQDYDGCWEIVIADNGMGPTTRAVVENWVSQTSRARLVTARGRRGAAHARNIGTAEASGDVLLYCDADDVVAPWWVSAMAWAAERCDFFAGVDEVLTVAADGSMPPWTLPASLSICPADTETRHAFLPWARGGNCGVWRAALQAVNGWNEDWLRGQDVELSWRLQTHGYRLYRVPAGRVRYRRPEGLWDDMRHQFEFGLRAHSLYRAAGWREAPHKSAFRELKRLACLVIRSPNLVLTAQRRRSWLVGASGIVGRWVGAWRCRNRWSRHYTER